MKTKLITLFVLLLSLVFSGQCFAQATSVTLSCTTPTTSPVVYWALITGGNSPTDPCTSSTCTILRQGPTNWLSSVTRVSAGLYQLNYSGTPFTNIPAAIISCEGINSGEIGQIRYGLSSSSQLTVQTVDPTTLSRGDGSFSVLVPSN